MTNLFSKNNVKCLPSPNNMVPWRKKMKYDKIWKSEWTNEKVDQCNKYRKIHCERVNDKLHFQFEYFQYRSFSFEACDSSQRTPLSISQVPTSSRSLEFVVHSSRSLNSSAKIIREETKSKQQFPFYIFFFLFSFLWPILLPRITPVYRIRQLHTRFFRIENLASRKYRTSTKRPPICYTIFWKSPSPPLIKREVLMP